MEKQKLHAADAAVEKILATCVVSPRYFISKWCKTKDEHDSKNSRKNFPDKSYLWWTLHQWHTGPSVILTAKSRQLMISWLLAAYGLWTAMFRPDSLVLWQSKKLEDAAPFLYEKSPQIARMSMMLASLPDWMQVCRTADNTFVPIPLDQTTFSYASIVLQNGSQILGLAQGPSQVESKVPTLFISDESSLQDEWSSTIAAAKPAIEKDAKILAVGTMRLPSDFGAAVAPSWETDHNAEGRGLAKFVSPDGIAGIRVHYSADPDKDPETPVGAAWKRGQLESGAYPGGERGWRWQQHMEINPQARSGTVCIPAFRDIQERIVVDDIRPAQTFGWSFDAGLDYGALNQSVFLLFGMRPDGRRFLLWEYSRPANEVGGIPGFCAEIKLCPWFRQVNNVGIQADPSLWNEDQNSQNQGLVSKVQIFEECGVNLVKAKAKGQQADEIALDRLNFYYWADPYPLEDFDPLFFICRSCKQTIKNFPNLMYEEWAEAAAENHGLKEKMRGKNVDEWDAFKYAEVAWKDVPKYTPPLEPGTLAWYHQRWKKNVEAGKPKVSGNLY